MRLPVAIPVVLLGLLGLAPAALGAPLRRPVPLVDAAPASTAFVDRVGPVARSALRVVGRSPAVSYAARDGLRVSVAFSSSYAADPAVAKSYVDFLDGLPHGSELGRLRVFIAPPDEVLAACGGEQGTLACYDPSTLTMTVPGEQLPSGAGGVTTSYVLAHEYGHHVARFRSNAPFPALSFGPKLWASQERVCLLTLQGRLAPGDEGANYLSNPGEAWADTYAHLTYPDVGWQFTPLLAPDAAAYDAARRDVLTPWTRSVTTVFHGRFARGGSSVRSFSFPLSLDGSLRVALSGPARANLDLALYSMGRRAGATSAPGSRDVYSQRFACREAPVERVVVRILRRSGAGPFSVAVTRAG